MSFMCVCANMFVSLPVRYVMYATLSILTSFYGWLDAWMDGCVSAMGCICLCTFACLSDERIGSRTISKALFNLVGKNGENLLYLLGILSAALMCLHVAVVTVRKNSWFNPYFLGLHRVTRQFSCSLSRTVSTEGHTISGWWFGTFYIFPYIGNNHPN